MKKITALAVFVSGIFALSFSSSFAEHPHHKHGGNMKHDHSKMVDIPAGAMAPTLKIKVSKTVIVP